MWSLKITNSLVLCFVLLFTHNKAQRRPACVTPNGERAQCSSIYSCPVLYDAITTRNQQQLRFLRESRCGYDADQLVCCGSYDNYRTWPNVRTTEPSFFADEPPRRTTNNKRTSSPLGRWDSFDERPNWGTGNRRTNPGWGSSPGGSDWGSEDNNQGTTNRRGGSSSSKLPDRSSCGIQDVDKILDGEVTSLREFPWMALLQYRKKSGNKVFSCGGSLISSRYVLTAAHCVRGQILTKIGPLVNVRLGEYNTETEKDCSTQYGFEMCNDKPFDSGIEKIIVHPDYSETSVDRYHDIALIKLKSEAPTTDFIKPICIPTATERSQVGDKLVVAGWGRTEYASSSPVKLKLRVPIVASSQCSGRFRSAGVTLGSRQLCAGGEQGRDSCNGDSGGPLMTTTKEDTSQWYVEGIVSFGAKCGSAGWPGIYTRVSDYVEWIKNNVD